MRQHYYVEAMLSLFAKFAILSCIRHFHVIAVQVETLRLSLPGDEGHQGELNGPGAAICYNLTFNDDIVREIVWWDRGRLSIRIEPCIGKPHMKASVYGCPSDGAPTVWEYMNDQMKGDLADSGKHVPADWEWVGDVESLLIEITHRSYFVEVAHHGAPYASTEGRDSFARFRIAAHIFDQEHQPMESLFPLNHACGWDRTLFLTPRTPLHRTFFPGISQAVPPDAAVTEIQWYPPGSGGVRQAGCEWHGNISWANLTYQVYVEEVTGLVGSSGVDYSFAVAHGVSTGGAMAGGDFEGVVRPPLCPPVAADSTGPCTRSACRICPRQYPACPKEFLTNCSEIAVNLAKLRTALNGTSRPLESYLKNPTRYTLWTPCGLHNTSDRIDPSRRVEFRPVDKNGGWAALPASLYPGAGRDGKWWTAAALRQLAANASAPPANASAAPSGIASASLSASPSANGSSPLGDAGGDPGGRLSIRIDGLDESRNNVYLINVVVRDGVSGERAAYRFLTLQMMTAKYVPPQLTDAEVSLFWGLGVSLGVLLAIFAAAALLVRNRRMQKRALKHAKD